MTIFSPALRNAWQASYTPPSEQAEPFAELPFPEFCERWLTVQDKDGEIVPLVLNRTQLDVHQHLVKYSRILILKARQLGVSTVVQAWHYYNIVRGNTRASTLCHDDDLTAELRDMADRFHDGIDEAYRPKRKYANAKVTTYPDNKSQARIATVGGHAGKNSAGKKKGRGGSNTDMHGTEVAFWADAKSVIAAALQAGNPRIVLESTGNGAQGDFYSKCINALRGDGIWTLLFYEWWWDDGYQMPLDPDEIIIYSDDEYQLATQHNLTAEQIKWRRYKQAEIGDLFQQEYPETPEAAFLTSGRGVFQVNKPGLFVPFVEDRSILGHPVYLAPDFVADDKSVLVLGADWGQQPDSSVVSIWDSTTYREIALYITGKRDYEYIIDDIVKLCQHLNVKYIVPEKNAMRMQISTLAKEILKAYADTPAPRISPFNMDLKRKDDLVKLLQQGFTMDLTLLDEPISKHELRIFEAQQNSTGSWSYAAPSGQHDDTVIARMLAHLACFQLRDSLK